MMKQIESLDIILAGGEGSRLFPITRDRAKPAAPYGGKYRIIDLPLNNHVNSGSRNIVVAAQYKPRSLERHIEHAWRPVFERERQQFIRVVKPEHHGYKGTADAIYQVVNLGGNHLPNVITVFCGDHIYLMDIHQMKQYHLDHNADLTIAATPVRRGLAAGNFGVLVVNAKQEVEDFQEKPRDPAPILGNEDYCWASMGNYAFKTATLLTALSEDSKKTTVNDENKDLVRANPHLYSTHDFGFDVIPLLRRQGKKIMIYDYQSNRPDQIITKGYWRDVGNLDQFIEANMDLTGPKPLLVLENQGWPLTTYDESHGRPSHISGNATGCVIANGVTIGPRTSLNRCVVAYNTAIEEGADLTDTILMGNNSVGKNVRINRTVVDRNVTIPNGTRIGILHEEDIQRGFTLSPGGFFIVPREYKFK